MWQVCLAFITSVDWGKVDNTGMAFQPSVVSNVSFVLSVFTAVARLLMIVVLQASVRATQPTSGRLLSLHTPFATLLLHRPVDLLKVEAIHKSG